MEFPDKLPATWKKIKDPHFQLCAVHLNGLRVLGDVSIKKDGKKWKHVSFSRHDRLPSYLDVKTIKNDFFGPDEWAIQIFPEDSNFVNLHPYCLHLWSCEQKVIPEMSEFGSI